jgi:hypothetical protein
MKWPTKSCKFDSDCISFANTLFARLAEIGGARAPFLPKEWGCFIENRFKSIRCKVRLEFASPNCARRFYALFKERGDS